MTTTSFYVGIDLAKAKFDVAVGDGGAKWHHQTFPQGPSGVEQLLAWLGQLGVTRSVVCMEATGTYGDEVAVALHEADYHVSVLNPAVLKAFRQSTLTRTKNDRIDAVLLGRYGAAHHPARWTPPTPEHQELQALARRMERLQDLRQQEANRLGSSTRSETVTASLEGMLTVLDQELARIEGLLAAHIQAHATLQEQHDLLQTIPGVGAKTATGLLAECGDLRQFEDARAAAAYAGLTPKEHTSGSSVHGKPRLRLSKMGSSRLRKILYFPAISAKTHNPIVRVFCERLLQRGKPKMTVIGAAMRKLLHIAYGVIKSGKPFDPNFGNKAPLTV